MDYTKEKEMITISAPALTWLAVHGNLALSLRHPANNGPSRKLIIEFSNMIEEKLIEVGLLDKLTVAASRKLEREESPHGQEAEVWVRDNEALQVFLDLVDVKGVPLNVIESWTDEEVRQVEDWATAVHLEAGDYDIQVPPVPEVLKAYKS